MARTKFILIILLLTALILKTNAQIIDKKNLFVNAGIVVNSGTVLNRIGFFAGGYYVYKQVQLNFNLRPVYNLSGIGTLKEFAEMQTNLGLVVGFGGKDSIVNKFVTQNSNQTQQKYAVGFSYNIYIDKIGTSQPTGTFFAEFNHFGLSHENDMWGEPRTDRYRSAGAKFYYRTKNWKYSGNIILWHGDVFDYHTFKYDNQNYPSRFGYKDLSESKYGKLSHGIINLQLDYALPSCQIISSSIGLDSEHVRNISQNIIVHDEWFLPEKFIGYKLKHYPMLMENGEPYLFKPSQRVRPAKFFLNIGFNQAVYY